MTDRFWCARNSRLNEGLLSFVADEKLLPTRGLRETISLKGERVILTIIRGAMHLCRSTECFRGIAARTIGSTASLIATDPAIGIGTDRLSQILPLLS